MTTREETRHLTMDPVAYANSVVRRHERENRTECEWLKRVTENPQDPEFTLADLAEITGQSRTQINKLVTHSEIGRIVRTQEGRRRVVRWSEIAKLADDVGFW
jgi:hypothetical protein